MLVLDPLLRGILLPGVLALVLAWALGRTGLAVTRRAAVGLGVAYAAAHAAMMGVPSWPPVEATQVLVWLVVGVLLPILLGLFAPGPLKLTVAAGMVLSAASVFLILRPMLAYQWKGAGGLLRMGVLAALLLLWAVLLECSAGRVAGAWLLGALAASSGALGAALALSGSMFLAQLAGAAAVALSALWLVLRAGPLAGGGLVPVVCLVLGGLLLVGVYFAELPTVSALLVVAAPFGVWAGKGSGSWRTSVMRVAGVALPLAAAVVIAYLANAPGPDDLPY